MNNNDNIDMDKLNKMPLVKRIRIASKVENRVKAELGEYNISKNDDYKKLVEEVGEEFGITANEALLLYLGWDAHKRVQNHSSI